eukprot:scaffold538_cov127-Alexandrium_tamarense.AAC.2
MGCLRNRSIGNTSIQSNFASVREMIPYNMEEVPEAFFPHPVPPAEVFVTQRMTITASRCLFTILAPVTLP